MSSIEIAFSISKQVFAGELSQTEGARELADKYAFNVNSAKIMIAVYSKMIRGLEFKRALSSSDMSYFLARIMGDGGARALTNPLTALRKHIDYYEAKNNVSLNVLRDVYSNFLAISSGTTSFSELSRSFDSEVINASKVSRDERLIKISEWDEAPKTRTVLVTVFERNPYVVAEVLDRANGVCERCKSNAPFTKKKDDNPYLEVHHLVRLADGGLDTVANAIALCPNCHRELHFGKPRNEANQAETTT